MLFDGMFGIGFGSPRFALADVPVAVRETEGAGLEPEVECAEEAEGSTPAEDWAAVVLGGARVALTGGGFGEIETEVTEAEWAW
jgi:hypothetical protein